MANYVLAKDRGRRCHISPSTFTRYFYRVYTRACLASGSVSVLVLDSPDGQRDLSTTQRYAAVNDYVEWRAGDLV
jgi:hypothetical protein